MAQKFLIPVIVGCVVIGVGAVLFDSNNDQTAHPSPSSTQHSSTAPHDQTLEREQSAKSRVTNSKSNIPPPKASVARAEPSHQPRLTDGLFVEVRHGVVTLRAERYSLKKVLESLAQESGVRINTQLIADRVLSIQLVHVPLDRALQTILEFEDSFLAFEHRNEAPAALKAVWVLPAGAGGTWSSHTSACSRDLSELEQQLTSVQSRQRAEAIETLVDLQGPDAAPAVVQSLGDQDENVRYRALQKAHGVGLALPPEVLTELVQHDSSALVRMMAVDAIGNHPSIDEQDKMAFARYAINDGSPAVQTRASELLSHLEFAPLLREQDQALSDEAEQEMSGEFPVGNLDERGE